MSLIQPVQNMTRQLDAAYEALANDPQSREKQKQYEMLRAKQDSLLLDARESLSGAVST